MLTIIKLLHRIGDLTAGVAEFCERESTRIQLALLGLTLLGVGLCALAVNMNWTGGWAFWVGFLMIMPGGVVIMNFMANTHTEQLKRRADDRYWRSKSRPTRLR